MCLPVDAFCKADEWMVDKFVGLVENAWASVHAAFYSTGLSDAQWSAATFFTNRFVAVLASVTVAVAIYQVIRVLAAGRPKDAMVPVAAAVLAWPATATAVWLAIRGAGAVDNLTLAMLSTGSGNEAVGVIFSKLAALDSAVPFMNAGRPEAVIGNNVFVAGLLSLVIWIVSIVMTLVLEFRNFALLVLIAFAPVAWMLLPAETTRAWIRSWTQMTIALILAKPVAAAVLMLAAELVVVTKADGWGAMLPGLVGLVIACASPAATLALVRFMGVNSASEGDAAAYAGMGNSQRGVVKVYRGGQGAARGASRGMTAIRTLTKAK